MNQNKGVTAKAYSEVAFVEVWRSAAASLSYLLKKWWIIAIAGVIGAAIGISYAWLKRPKFESRLTFALEESGGSLSSALSLAAEFGLNIGGGKDIFEGDNIIEIFNSRRMIERVLLSADTINGKVVSFADNFLAIQKEGSKKKSKPGRLDAVSFPYGQPREKFSYLQDSVLYNIYEGIINTDLSISKPDKKLSIYQINFTSLNERFSKEFTDKLVKETTSFYTELRSKRSRETLEILENRVAELKSSLNSAISGRSAIQDANVNPVFAAAQAPVLKKQVDITVYGGAYGELYKNLELARYQYLKAIPLLQIIDETQYPMKKIKLGRLSTGIVYAIIAAIICCIYLLGRKQWKKVIITELSE